MKPVTEMTDAELEMALESEDETAEKLAKHLSESEARLRAIEEEIENRKLDAYWKSEWISTGLAPLQIDDKVIITQRYRDWYVKLHTHDTLPPNFTEGRIIDLYVFEGKLCIRFITRFNHLNVTIDDKEIIADIRRAYMLLHPES